jgi:hypothetical protein
VNPLNLSIRSLLIIVALFAAGMAAVVAQNELAASAAISLYWLLFLLAIAGSLVGRGVTRAFCVGFAVFSFGYSQMAFESEAPQSNTGQLMALRWSRIAYYPSVNNSAEHSRFITSHLIDLLESRIQPRLEVGSQVTAQYNGGTYFTGKIKDFASPDYVIAWDDGTAPSLVPFAGIRGYTAHLRTSSHAVLGMLLAVLGGWATVLLFARTSDQSSARGMGATSPNH